MPYKVFTDVHKLLCDNSEAELDEDEDSIVNPEIIAASQYAAMPCQNGRKLYKGTSTIKRSSFGLSEF
jgi:hypothetical protein